MGLALNNLKKVDMPLKQRNQTLKVMISNISILNVLISSISILEAMTSSISILNVIWYQISLFKRSDTIKYIDEINQIRIEIWQEKIDMLKSRNLDLVSRQK